MRLTRDTLINLSKEGEKKNLTIGEKFERGIDIANKTINVVGKGAAIISGALEWANKASNSTDDDTAAIKATLEFVKKEQSTLVQYTGSMLTKSIQLLSMNAHEMKSALNDVYYMAYQIKAKTTDSKDYIEMIEEAADP